MRRNSIMFVLPVGLLFITLLMTGCVNTTGISEYNSTNAKNVSSLKQMQNHINVTQIIKESQNISYDNLLRYPSRYKGKLLHFRGQVLQSYYYKDESNEGMLLVWTKRGIVGYSDNIIWVDFNGHNVENHTRILEDDIVDIYGKFEGIKTYTTSANTDNTVPRIQAYYIKFVEMAS